MRTPLAAALFCLAPLAPEAQTPLALEAPVLVAAGERVPVDGAPLRAARFETLTLALPGRGTYTVSDRPFAGARRAGQFSGEGLFFASGGVSVRLLSAVPILGGARRDAYVREEPARGARGDRARVSIPAASGAPPARAARGPQAGASPERADPQAPMREEVRRLRAELARLQATRDADVTGARRAADARLARVRAERDALRAERDAALAERRALAGEIGRVRADLERAQQQGRRVAADTYAGDLRRLEREAESRDRAVAALTAERDERGAQIARLQAELAQAREATDAALAQRDAARADAARLRAAPEASGAAAGGNEAARLRTVVDGLQAELAEARAERDRLAQSVAVQPRATTEAVLAREAEIDRLAAEVEAARAEIAGLRAALAEADAARARLSSDRDALAADGDALRRERDALREQIAAMGSAPRPRASEAASPRASGAAPAGATASGVGLPGVGLPGFDFARLANADDVRRALAAARAPTVGSVLVLFQTDADGRVIRTAVPRPLGSDADAVAEAVVRAMRFVPVRADGRPTGIRSQVLVRFGG